jgi:Uma2 family endonuclease
MAAGSRLLTRGSDFRARGSRTATVRERTVSPHVFFILQHSIIQNVTLGAYRRAVYSSPMAILTIELPANEDQTAFNVRRWSQLQNDPELVRQFAKFEGRIETDRHGHIIMYPPPGYSHGGYQAEIAHLLRILLPEGRVATETPLSTADGVKGVDVTWISKSRLAAIDKRVCLTKAPEICVEVLSPSNTLREMAEKRALYFAAGAREVWLCDEKGEKGRVTFFTGVGSRGQKSSRLCPDFPRRIAL